MDYAHRLFEVLRYLLVSTAIVHITSVDRLGDATSTDTLVFTCAILGECLMYLLLNLELCARGQGETGAIQHHTKMIIKKQILPTIVVYVAAAVVAVMMLARSDEDGGGYDAYGRSLGSAATVDYDTPVWELSDLPLTLTAFGYLQNVVLSAYSNFQIANGRFGDIK